MKLSKIVPRLAEYCNVHLAEPWDNVGLLVEPRHKHDITKIIVTNDLTLNVMQESIEKNVDMIVAYHPPVFKPLKSVTHNHWKSKIVSLCIENKIAVYSPHTGLDAKDGGINDWLLSPFEMNLTPYNAGQDSYTAVVDVPESHLAKFNEKLAMMKVPYEKNCGFSKGDNNINGSGRIAVLKDDVSVSDVCNLYKKLFDINHIKLALGHQRKMDEKVSIIGVCAGSGGSFLMQNEKVKMCDLFVTGEASHHEQLEAVSNGCSVITVGHSVSERNFLRNVLVPWMQNEFDTETIMSSLDKEPGEII